MKVLTREEVAWRLRVEPSTIQKWTQKGRLGFVKVNGVHMHRPEHVTALIEAHRA